MSDRRATLQARRETLLARGAAQREHVAAELDGLDAGAAQIDRYVALARRMRPALILGGVALVAMVGPRRLLGLVRGTAVSSLLAHQLIRQVPGLAARLVQRAQVRAQVDQRD